MIPVTLTILDEQGGELATVAGALAIARAPDAWHAPDDPAAVPSHLFHAQATAEGLAAGVTVQMGTRRWTILGEAETSGNDPRVTRWQLREEAIF